MKVLHPTPYLENFLCSCSKVTLLSHSSWPYQIPDFYWFQELSDFQSPHLTNFYLPEKVEFHGFENYNSWTGNAASWNENIAPYELEIVKVEAWNHDLCVLLSWSRGEARSPVQECIHLLSAYPHNRESGGGSCYWVWLNSCPTRNCQMRTNTTKYHSFELCIH